MAHNPLQSSLKLSIYEQSGILEVNLAQYGVEQALVKKYPDLNLKSTTPKDFKELLINYLKENILISVNGQQLKIGKGAIKLGNHQTDLKFQLDNIPEDPKCMDVDIHCFQENEKQQNFFKIAYKGLNVREKLTKENDFKAKFTITESEILINNKTESLRNDSMFWVLAAISLLLISFLILRLRK